MSTRRRRSLSMHSAARWTRLAEAPWAMAPRLAVEQGTTEIFLEAATWEPRSIRRTASMLGLRTEASSRFEKGLSPALSLPAVDRAAALVAELAGGKSTKSTDVYSEPLKQPKIEVTAQRVERVLGLKIKPAEAAAILERLHFSVEHSDGALLTRPPDFRLDCTIPEDLVEEIGRVYGYDRVPSTLPGERTPVRDLYQSQDADEVAREVLAGRELDEAVTNSLVSSTGTSDIGMPAAPRSLVRIENPMAENRDALRGSLLPGLLEALALNARQDRPGARLVVERAGRAASRRDRGAPERARRPQARTLARRRPLHGTEGVHGRA